MLKFISKASAPLVSRLNFGWNFLGFSCQEWTSTVDILQNLSYLDPGQGTAFQAKKLM